MQPLPFILMPDSDVISYWNVIMMLLLLYTATYVPFKTAFVDESPQYVNNIEFAIDSLFFIDIVVNFISAYENAEKNIEFRLSYISWMYIRTWFLFDVFSCIPFQYLDLSSPDVQAELGVDIIGSGKIGASFVQHLGFDENGVQHRHLWGFGHRIL
jgi:Ion transport protein